MTFDYDDPDEWDDNVGPWAWHLDVNDETVVRNCNTGQQIVIPTRGDGAVAYGRSGWIAYALVEQLNGDAPGMPALRHAEYRQPNLAFRMARKLGNLLWRIKRA